jgi:hypothetical protein
MVATLSNSLQLLGPESLTGIRVSVLAPAQAIPLSQFLSGTAGFEKKRGTADLPQGKVGRLFQSTDSQHQSAL